MNKALFVIGVAGVLTYNVPVMSAKAISIPKNQTYTEEIQPRTVGLISRYSLKASNSGGKLCLNGYTVSNATMQSIGYKNIVIEYSTDNSHWYVENDDIDDILKSGMSYYLNNYTFDVVGGYYYRVTCTHYAKESGLFGSSQSLSNTSNSVWIG